MVFVLEALQIKRQVLTFQNKPHKKSARVGAFFGACSA